MQAVTECPNDPIAQLEPQVLKLMVEHNVEWIDFSIINVVANLPAN